MSRVPRLMQQDSRACKAAGQGSEVEGTEGSRAACAGEQAGQRRARSKQGNKAMQQGREAGQGSSRGQGTGAVQGTRRLREQGSKYEQEAGMR